MGTIGDRLRDERTRLGVSQKVFASWGGVSTKTQVLYEKGERFPDARYLIAVEEHGADSHFILMGQRISQGGSEEKGRLYDKPEDALFVVLAVQEELGLKLDADQLKNLLGYAYTGQVNQKDLNIFVESAFRLAGIDLPSKEGV